VFFFFFFLKLLNFLFYFSLFFIFFFPFFLKFFFNFFFLFLKVGKFFNVIYAVYYDTLTSSLASFFKLHYWFLKVH